MTLLLTALGLAVLAGGLLYGEPIAKLFLSEARVSGGSKADYRGSGEQTLVQSEIEECGSGAACAPKPNPTRVPNVVGMRAEAACRALLRSDYLGYIWGKRQSDEFEPGRIVAQKPEPGTILDYTQGVFLFVSEPFPDVLPPNTHCAERKVGPLD